MNKNDLVQRALHLLMQPIESVKTEEALRQQQELNQAPTVHPGDRIEWHRADGSMHSGVVDYIHIDAEGGSWAFVTIGERWAAVNLKFATVRTDADSGDTRYPPLSPDLVA